MSHADTIRAGILAPDGAPNGNVVHEALAALDALVSEIQQLRDALKAITEVASVSYSGDSWYCENEGVDASAAFALVKAALNDNSEVTT